MGGAKQVRPKLGFNNQQSRRANSLHRAPDGPGPVERQKESPLHVGHATFARLAACGRRVAEKDFYLARTFSNRFDQRHNRNRLPHRHGVDPHCSAFGLLEGFGKPAQTLSPVGPARDSAAQPPKVVRRGEY